MLAIDNTTISGNTAGSGIAVLGATNSNGIIRNSTIAPDRIEIRTSGTYTIENSIVDHISKLGTGTLQTSGVNLLRTASGSGLSAGPDLLVGDLKLGPLGDYGGPTQTMALMFGSPAIDSGDTALGSELLVDQRGRIRVRGNEIDIGAFESAALNYVDTVDRDGDGMTDTWEVFFGLDPDDPSDGLLDFDGDGLSNGAEALARTNPQDANSRLEIVHFSRAPNVPQPGDEMVSLRWTSVPNMRYSLWQSQNLVDWAPIEDSNVIAVESETALAFVGPMEARLFVQVRVGAAPGIADPVYAEFSNALAPLASWLPDSIVNTGPDSVATGWLGEAGIHSMLSNGSPRYREDATPNGSAAVEFRGGSSNDALATDLAAGQLLLDGATSFTVVAAFSPDGDSEGRHWSVVQPQVSDRER